MEMHPLRTEGYYGSKVGDPLLHTLLPSQEESVGQRLKGHLKQKDTFFFLSAFYDRIS